MLVGIVEGSGGGTWAPVTSGETDLIDPSVAVVDGLVMVG